jgi:hypothetical protein
MSRRTVPFHGAPDEHDYVMLERRYRAASDAAVIASPSAVVDEFFVMHARVDADVHAIKARLFTPSLASRDDDKAASRWISAQNRRLARVARRMAEGFVRLQGPTEDAVRLAALGMHYMGESVKGHMKEFHFHEGLHRLMRIAFDAGRHHDEIRLEVGGRAITCSFSSLYFRALVLARLAGGGLTFAQIEIVDAWMWMWMPALEGLDSPPEGVAWRADLDSNEGLRCGAPSGSGPSLYLARAPLEAVRLAIIREFHAGRTVAGPGDVARFSNADHFAALDAVRRALRGVRHESLGRGERYEARDVAFLHVGLVEVMGEALAAKADGAPSIALMPMMGERGSGETRERDHTSGEVRAGVSRLVQLTDVSESGVGVEGEEAECSEVAVDDLVALRLKPTGPLLLARVVRRLPAATGGRVVIGLRALTSSAQLVVATQTSHDADSPDLSVLYIPGPDDSGRNDAYLTCADVADGRKLFDTLVGEDVFTFRFNRVRERGRGWVMAGFEITSMRRLPPKAPGGGRFDKRMRA